MASIETATIARQLDFAYKLLDKTLDISEDQAEQLIDLS